MDRKLKLQVVFAALDKMSGTLRGIGGGSRSMAASITAARKEVVALQKAQAQVGTFRKLKREVAGTQQAMKAAQVRVAALRREIENTANPTGKMRRELTAAEKASERAKAAFVAQATQIRAMRGELSSAGISARDLGSHERQLGDRVAAANRQIDAQKSKLEQLARTKDQAQRLKDFGGKAALSGAALTAGVTAPLIMLGRESVQASVEGADAVAQVQARLASMGDRAGRSLAQLRAQATNLMHGSLYDDDVILRDITANLLTFGKVAGRQFDLAQQAAIDFAAASKREPQAAAIMLGKALQDPVRGLVALRKAGVDFSEQQRVMIARMIETGNIAGAQNMILAEMQKEFGGSAMAARKANPFAAMAIDIGELKQAIGDELVPALMPLIQQLTEAVRWFSQLSPGTRKFIVIAGILAAVLGPVILAMSGLVAIVAGLAAIGVPVAAAIGAIGAILLVLGSIIYGAMTDWEGFKNSFVIALAAMYAPLVSFVQGVYAKWLEIKAAFSNGIAGIKAVFNGLPDWFKKVFGGAASAAVNGFFALFNPGVFASRAVAVAHGLASAFKGALKVNSPSKVFMAIGGSVTEGLQLGIDRTRQLPIGSIRKMGAGITAAGALSIAGAAHATPNAARAGGSMANPVTHNWYITQQPGEDGEALAQRIARMIDRNGQVAARRSYVDQD